MNRFFRGLATPVVSLVLALGILMTGIAPAWAASAPPDTRNASSAATVHTSKDIPPSRQLTSAEVAYGAEKQQLSNEYNNLVLKGKESLAVYEAHMTAFMIKYRLGNVTNLHNVLMKTAKQNKLSTLSGPSILCPTSPCGYTGAAQFPEERSYWCGPATMATTLVEDSFSWPGTRSNGSVTLTYNPYVTEQSQTTATNDEAALDPYLIPAGWYATGPSYMLDTANNFVGGKGGWYALVWGNANFQANVNTDISGGWDIPTGLTIPANQYTPLGYPVSASGFDHWVPVTYISGGTIYYADPTYHSPYYTTWNTPGPYASAAVSDLALYTSSYIW